MAVMKPAAPGAGSRRGFLLRGAALAGALAALATVGGGGTAIARVRAEHWLEPAFGITGATLTDKADGTGYPLPGGRETYLPFMFPVAVVASLGSIYVADAGHRRLFRYERNSGLMHALPGVRIAAGSLLRSSPDGTLYVLDAMRGEIQRYGVDGRPLPALHPRVPSSRYLDFAVDGSSGRVFAVDAMWSVVDQIEPLGRIALAHFDVPAAGPMAIFGDSLLVADAKCKCVSEWRGGRLVRQLAAGKIRLPKALVADAGEIYVLDGFDRSISRVFQGGLETIPAAELNLLAPDQISVSGGMMYVADGASRTVAAFRIRRHRK